MNDRRVLLPLAVLSVLLLLKYAIVFSAPLKDVLVGDEHDYLGKAMSIWRSGSVHSREVTEGKLQYTDFRPPGYPLVVAPLLWFGDSLRELRSSLRFFQCTLDLLVTLFLFHLCCSFSRGLPYRFAAAVGLGVQPFTNGFVTSGYSDTVVTFLVTAGVAALWRYRSQGAKSPALWLVAGSVFLSASFAMRPEMIIFAFALMALAVLSRRVAWSRRLRDAVVAAVPFLLVVGGLVAYRMQVHGEMRIYGKFLGATPGLMQWSQTWAGSEKTKTKVVWGLPKGEDPMKVLPGRAFDSEQEKTLVRGLVDRVARSGEYTAEDDGMMGELARARIARNPFRYHLAVPLYQSVHGWLNLETSSGYLHFFSRLPRALSRSAVGLMLLLRVGFLVLAVVGGVALWRQWRANSLDRTAAFLALGLFFVLSRTVFFGFFVKWVEARYLLPAWPFVIALAAYGAAGIPASPARRVPGRT